MKRNNVVTGVVLLILAVFGWAGWTNWEYRKQAADKRLSNSVPGEGAEDDSQTSLSPFIGKPAPDFSLEDMNGKKVSLADYKGKVVLVNFWATWCGPCKLETPWLVDLRNQYASQGFEILGIDTEGDDLGPNDTEGWARDKAEIARFVKEEHMPYPVLINGDSLSKPYGGLDAMPTSFFVDRNGIVVAAQRGITSKDDMEEHIRKALKSNS